MTTRNMRIALASAGLALMGGTGILCANYAANAQTIPPPTKVKHEKHPELRRALRNLEKAQTNLTKAAHDFDGHREKALDLTQKAIEETKLALASDAH